MKCTKKGSKALSVLDLCCHCVFFWEVKEESMSWVIVELEIMIGFETHFSVWLFSGEHVWVIC